MEGFEIHDKKRTTGGTRTRNPRLTHWLLEIFATNRRRRPMPYPLGHGGTQKTKVSLPVADMTNIDIDFSSLNLKRNSSYIIFNVWKQC